MTTKAGLGCLLLIAISLPSLVFGAASAPVEKSPAPPPILIDVSPNESAISLASAETNTFAPSNVRVLKAYDGDTLDVQGGERVRVLFINTPEKKEELGPEAGELTRDLILMKKVDLLYSGDRQRDGYGRLLAEVRFDDNQDLATQLLRNGLAHLFLIAPGSAPANLDSLLEAQAEARAENRNIWATDRYSGDLHITSFHANARGDDRENLYGEYVRIANLTTEPLNIQGYSISCEHGKVLTFPDYILPAGYSFQVVSGQGPTNDNPERGSLKIYWGTTRPVWNNTRDSATLKDPQGRVIDRVVHAPKRH